MQTTERIQFKTDKVLITKRMWLSMRSEKKLKRKDGTFCMLIKHTVTGHLSWQPVYWLE